jgi:hypothetical protein
VEGAGGLGGDGARDGVRAFPLSGVETAGTRVAPVGAVMAEEGWRARLAPTAQASGHVVDGEGADGNI